MEIYIAHKGIICIIFYTKAILTRNYGKTLKELIRAYFCFNKWGSTAIKWKKMDEILNE